MSGHLERLEREAGVPGLVDTLVNKLSPTDLQSLLLEVYRRRAEGLEPSEVLRRYKDSRFTGPSPIPPEKMMRVHQLIAEQLRDSFDFVELSPLAPLGACASVATCDQNKIVSTVRNLEVASDPTNALALEASLRRKESGEVHLGALQRVVRAQAMEGGGEFYAHFGLLGLVSSCRQGRELPGRHLGALLRLLKAFPGDLGRIKIALTPLDNRGEAAVKELEGRFPDCEVTIDRERETGRGYYHKLCYKIYGGGVELGDGGYTDWTAKLTANGKEQCFISGIGLERLAARSIASHCSTKKIGKNYPDYRPNATDQ